MHNKKCFPEKIGIKRIIIHQKCIIMQHKNNRENTERRQKWQILQKTKTPNVEERSRGV